MSQIIERFASAIEVLLGDGPVKNRLAAAYSAHLEDLRQVELQIPGKSQLSELHAAMHSVAPAGRLSPVTASVQKMSPAEASGHARTILRLYAELLAADYATRSAAEAPLDPGEQRTPRFLASARR